MKIPGETSVIRKAFELLTQLVASSAKTIANPRPQGNPGRTFSNHFTLSKSRAVSCLPPYLNANAARRNLALQPHRAQWGERPMTS